MDKTHGHAFQPNALRGAILALAALLAAPAVATRMRMAIDAAIAWIVNVARSP